MFKRYVSLLASILLTVSLFVPFAQATGDEQAENFAATKSEQTRIDVALDKVISFMLEGPIESEWEAVGLAKAGIDVPTSYKEVFYANVEQQLSSSRLKITDAERLTLAAVAIGEDPNSVNGFNLLDFIYNSRDIREVDTMTRQGTNGLIFALIALDSKNFTIPNDARWNRKKIIGELLKYQREDGAWSLSLSSTGSASYDITAMALISLAPYTKQPEVNEAVNRAVSFLSEQQGPTGGFDEAFVGGISSEATSQVIIGLTANNIDPESQQFTKNGVNLIDHLLSFQTESGGFKHTAGESGANGMATEQALQGLVAYDLYTKGEGRLYDFSETKPEPQPELEIAGPSVLKGIINGNLLNVQKDKNGLWSPIFIQNTEMKEGYYIVQAGETGDQSTQMIPQGTKKVFLVENDMSYRYFDAEVVPSTKPWTITFNKTVKNTPANLLKIYVEDVKGNDVPVNVTASGKTVTVTPKSNYTSGQLYSLFIVEPESQEDTVLKQATRKLFIIQ